MSWVISPNQSGGGEEVINHIWIKTIQSIERSSHSSHSHQPPALSPSTASTLFDPGPVSTHQPTNTPTPLPPPPGMRRKASSKQHRVGRARRAPCHAYISTFSHRLHCVSSPAAIHQAALSASQHDYKAAGVNDRRRCTAWQEKREGRDRGWGVQQS